MATASSTPNIYSEVRSFQLQRGPKGEYVVRFIYARPTVACRRACIPCSWLAGRHRRRLSLRSVVCDCTQVYEVCWLTKLKVAGMRETVRKSAVWRRYSQFKALDQCVHALPQPSAPPSLADVAWLRDRALRKRYGWLMQDISFPPGKIFGNTNPTFVEKRRGDLNAYIQQILKVQDITDFDSHNGSPELMQFFEYSAVAAPASAPAAAVRPAHQLLLPAGMSSHHYSAVCMWCRRLLPPAALHLPLLRLQLHRRRNGARHAECAVDIVAACPPTRRLRLLPHLQQLRLPPRVLRLLWRSLHQLQHQLQHRHQRQHLHQHQHLRRLRSCPRWHRGEWGSWRTFGSCERTEWRVCRAGWACDPKTLVVRCALKRKLRCWHDEITYTSNASSADPLATAAGAPAADAPADARTAWLLGRPACVMK